MLGLIIGVVIPGGAQWCARRWWTGLVFLACALVIAGYAAPRFGWPVAVFVPVVALAEQALWWRERRR